MPNKPKSHDEFRASVCVGCHKPGCERRVKDTLEKKVQEKIYSGFSLNDTSMPFGICDACRLALKEANPIYTISYENKQALRNSCELLRQKRNCMQAQGNACKLM